MTFPYEWATNIVDTQIVKLGGFVIATLPGEFTTMSGRRLRGAMEAVATAEGVEIEKIILTGLSNAYTGYITTYEEYQQQVIRRAKRKYLLFVLHSLLYIFQRYEGASTLYGPHTLRAYMEQYELLFDSLLKVRKFIIVARVTY